MRLGFAGTPEFAVPALKRLCALKGASVVGVLTQPDRPAGRGQHATKSPVKLAAEELGLPVHQPPTLKSAEGLKALLSLDLEVLVVAAYGLILPKAALEAPRRGCINIHASLLPRWRGAAPIQRALLAGDARSGITIMRMELGLDTGPMLSWRDLEIDEEDTAASLHDRLALLGADLMAETLPSVLDGSARELKQPESGVTYAAKLTKAEARIDWSRSALEISRQVRAFNPWPVAETTLEGKQLRIWDARVTSEADREQIPVAEPGLVLSSGADGVEVVTGQGLLTLTRLQLAGRKALPAAEFLKAQSLTGAKLT